MTIIRNWLCWWSETLQSLRLRYQYVGWKLQKEVNSPVDGKKELNHSAFGWYSSPNFERSQAQKSIAQKPSEAPVLNNQKVDSKETSRTEIIPFQVEEVEADDLPQGQTEVIQAVVMYSSWPAATFKWSGWKARKTNQDQAA